MSINVEKEFKEFAKELNPNNKFFFGDKIIEYVTLLTGPVDATNVTIELMDTPGEEMKRHLKSFAMLRKKVYEIEENLAKGITMDSFVEKNVEKYDEDFPSLGGPP